LRELAAIEANEPIREQIAELVLLRRTRDMPVWAEHKATDAGQIEILVDHPTEIGGLARQRHVGADYRDRLVAKSTDERDRRFVGRGRSRRGGDGRDHREGRNEAFGEQRKGGVGMRMSSSCDKGQLGSSESRL